LAPTEVAALSDIGLTLHSRASFERFVKIATTFDFGVSGRDYCTRNYFSDPNEWLSLFKAKGDGKGT
jgi:hypothetical protein